MDKDEAHDYLSSLLNQNLRIHTTDGRMFRGTFKCTDPVCSPRSHNYEHRHLHHDVEC